MDREKVIKWTTAVTLNLFQGLHGTLVIDADTSEATDEINKFSMTNTGSSA